MNTETTMKNNIDTDEKRIDLNKLILYKGNIPNDQDLIKRMESLGAPQLKAIYLLPGKDIESKVLKWFNDNWMKNTGLTRWLVGLTIDLEKFSIKSLEFQSKEGVLYFKGVIRFLVLREKELKQLRMVHFPHILDYATEVPEISKVFDTMSFADRQKFLRQNIEGRLELNI